MSKGKVLDFNKKEETKPDVATPPKVDKQPGELNFKPHPNVIFGVPVYERKTKGGVILPEQSKQATPICELFAVGENVEIFEEGDFVYIDPSYMRMAEIDGVKGVILMQDGIFGHVTNYYDE